MSSGSGDNGESGQKPLTDAKPSETNNQHQLQKKGKGFAERVKPPRFVGACAEMQGHVFDCYHSKVKQVDEFQKTLEHLKNYIGGKFGPLVGKSISNLEVNEIIEPAEPFDVDNTIEMKKWEKRYNLYLAKVDKLEEDLKKTYTIIWGQCSDIMQSRLQEMTGFQEVEDTLDALRLIRLVKNVSFNYRTHQHPVLAMHITKYDFYKFNQGRHQTVQEFYDTFNNLLDVNETVGSNLGTDIGLIRVILAEQGIDPNEATAEQTTEAAVLAKQRYNAMAMLASADKYRFGGLLEELRNDYRAFRPQNKLELLSPMLVTLSMCTKEVTVLISLGDPSGTPETHVHGVAEAVTLLVTAMPNITLMEPCY